MKTKHICLPPPFALSVLRPLSHLEMVWVDGAVGGAVERALGGDLQRVHELMATQTATHGAAQLQQGVADPTRSVIHQLRGEVERNRERKVRMCCLTQKDILH